MLSDQCDVAKSREEVKPPVSRVLFPSTVSPPDDIILPTLEVSSPVRALNRLPLHSELLEYYSICSKILLTSFVKLVISDCYLMANGGVVVPLPSSSTDEPMWKPG